MKLFSAPKGEGFGKLRGAWMSSPWLLIGVMLVAAMVLALLAVMGVSVVGGNLAAAQLSDAADLIEQADESVVGIDKVVGAQITSDLAEPAEAALDKVEPARDQLEQAISIIRAASPDLLEKDQDRAQLLTRAARGRLEMLAQAPVILQTTSKSARALPTALDAWQSVLDAEVETDRAVAAQRKLTKASVTESAGRNRTAGGHLSRARAGFTQAEEAFPEADFDSYIAYVDVLIEMNKLSIESDEAWLQDDLAKANARTTQYNDLGSKSLALRKNLPASPSTKVGDAFEDVAGRASDTYYAARKKATTADSQLR